MEKKPEKSGGLGQDIAKILTGKGDAKSRIEEMHKLLKKAPPAPPLPASSPTYSLKDLLQQRSKNVASSDAKSAPSPAPTGPALPRQDISVVTDLKHLLSCYRIRHSVFTEEQNIPQEVDIDDEDLFSIHFLIYEKGRPVGTARMTPGADKSAKIGRMAVMKTYRRRGYGSRLLAFILEFAKTQDIKFLTLSAQQGSIAFYEKVGFSKIGSPYREAGIPHIKMQLKLA